MNTFLFENGQREESRIISRILMDIKEFKDIGEDEKVDTILNPIYFDEKPIGFFDDATVNENYGVGIFLKLCAQHVYKAYFVGGKGNNMKAEIMGLWGLLHLAHKLSIKKLMVVGDSKVTIDWINDCSNLNLMYLHGWKD
jgi:hypothetical protein